MRGLKLRWLAWRRTRRAHGGARAKTALDYVSRPDDFRPGSRIEVLRAGGEAFPAMLAAIRAARRMVHLETYILRADRIGREFARALGERAQAGVKVRLLYDAVGSISLPAAFVEEVAGAGVEVLQFRPLSRWRSGATLHRRDHQKILVVDDEVAFTGGINIGDEYASLEQGGTGWHDVHARIKGAAVTDLAAIFRSTWIRAGGTPFPEPPAGTPAPPAAKGESLTWTVSNSWFWHRSRMRHAYLRAIRSATRGICVMNAYFIPDRGLRRAFYRAVERGAAVRIIVPGATNQGVVRYASCHLYSRILSRGVRLFEWQGAMMHAKTAVIDGLWSTIGSYNIDRRSFTHNLEVAVIVLDPLLGVRMEEQFEREIEGCREIVLDEWRRRPRVDRLFEWFSYLFRYWL